jgi:hypothetical protein
MFALLRRIADALDQIATAHEAQVRILAADSDVHTKAKALMVQASALVTASNDRAAWYHQEASALKIRIDALTEKVRKMEAFQ